MRLAQGFREQYGAAVGAFWKEAKHTGHGYEVLREASRELRSRNKFAGFFEEKLRGFNDGWARNAFHRIIRDQTEQAAEFADHLRLNNWSVMEALVKVRPSTFKHDESKRLALAWALLRTLFKEHRPFAPALEPDDEDGDVKEEDTSRDNDVLSELAEVALKLLGAGVGGNLLFATERRKIVELLKAARKERPYQPPLPTPPLPPAQRKQRLFADLRLNSFGRLLRQTAPA